MKIHRMIYIMKTRKKLLKSISYFGTLVVGKVKTDSFPFYESFYIGGYVHLYCEFPTEKSDAAAQIGMFQRLVKSFSNHFFGAAAADTLHMVYQYK